MARGAVDELTLEEQVGQLVVLSFAGTAPPSYVLEALHERRAAGVILLLIDRDDRPPAGPPQGLRQSAQLIGRDDVAAEQPANTDDAIVTIKRTRAALDAVDLPPFEAAIAAGVPLVMVTHARYPALDRSRIASQSQPIIHDLLRDELGFRGVVVTDSMEAQASLATGRITMVSERAVRAGADLLLLTGRGSYRPVYEHLLAVARDSREFRARVHESATRVLALKARGALPPS